MPKNTDPLADTSPRCFKCKFFERDKTNFQGPGYCKENSPQWGMNIATVKKIDGTQEIQNFPYFGWPMVPPSEWCGRFQHKFNVVEEQNDANT